MGVGSKWKIWIDTGGTFTDCMAIDPTGMITRIKVLSSGKLRGIVTKVLDGRSLQISQNWGLHQNIFNGYVFSLLGSEHEPVFIEDYDIEKGIMRLSKQIDVSAQMAFEIAANEEAPVLVMRLATACDIDEVLPPMEIRLGSTKGTNALLENKEEAPILITTKGFADLSVIGTQQRENLFSLDIKKPDKLFSKVIEVEERINAKGEILAELTESKINKILREVYKSDNKVVAIVFLNSYINPEHERNLLQILKTAGYKYACASYQLEQSINFLARTETTLVNAYLMPVIQTYIRNIQAKLHPNSTLKVMTSSGGLVDGNNFYPKDSLLSGPAGGISGAALVGHKQNCQRLLSFDMGGTSTDVSRYDGAYDYVYQTQVGNYRIMSPSLYIETVAAGGGSICSYDGYRLTVGPESAGAQPGPACYGGGGPLTITDVNLLLGRIDSSCFGIPLDINHSRLSLLNLIDKHESLKSLSEEEILEGFIEIANEKMAKTIERISIRKGYDPKTYTLLAFGGAGGLHACSIASVLEIKNIIVPYDAGILSAYGIGRSRMERMVNRQVLKLLDDALHVLPDLISEMKREASRLLYQDGLSADQITETKVLLQLRFSGQDEFIEVALTEIGLIKEQFQETYTRLYGHYFEDRDIELESVRMLAGSGYNVEAVEARPESFYQPKPFQEHKSCQGGQWITTPVYRLNNLKGGAKITGPAILLNDTSTTFIDSGWEGIVSSSKDMLITETEVNIDKHKYKKPEQVQLELFTNRFRSVVEDMGAMLSRTAFSVNIKERLDFSCALLDAQGYLVVNAPHIPVHLGALGLCVRKVLQEFTLMEGDIIVTNHPAYGGSHLPDITLIAPVFVNGMCVAYLANRAHHAEIGGISPGSMPAHAKNLKEEGVVISPLYIARKGVTMLDKVRKVLTKAKYPTRSIDENMADFKAAIASIRYGEDQLLHVCNTFGAEEVVAYMTKLNNYSGACLSRRISDLPKQMLKATEKLDDGSILSVEIKRNAMGININFVGCSAQHTGNMNATPAIVYSTVLYVLRLLIDENIPLNEGFLKHVKIDIPPSLLNPAFGNNPATSPAVVGGNVEVSQRLVDTLLKAFGVAACSQGTMNNLLFGNAHFGFYETICGGVGAINGSHGASAVHQHMTNTRITDAEIMELRYPVQVEKFCVRSESGGKGKWNGGDGVERQIRFLEPVELTLLCQHRVEEPYGMDGGKPGSLGEQYLVTESNELIPLQGMDTIDLKKGEAILIKTPGGGAWGVL